MEMIPVQSGNLKAIGYDEDEAILKIEFLNGRLFEYYDVPQYEFDGLERADSKGTYANQNIYKNYRGQRIS